MNSSTALGAPPSASGEPPPSVSPAAVAAHTPRAAEAQRALLERPAWTLRARLTAIFIILCALMSVVTVGAVVFLSAFKTKSVFLEAMTNYALEIQQARRFEKNVFLYGTNLDDALTHAEAARYCLERNARDFRSVAGQEGYVTMVDTLARYQQQLDRLEELESLSRQEDPVERQEIESNLRRYGTRLIREAEESIARERATMHAMLHTSRVLALGFLVFMLLVTAGVAGFLTRAIVNPLRRYESYALRIGKGDYSPILPARRYRDEFSSLAVALNQMLEELQAHQEQLAQSAKMAAVGTLTSGIAHELNNPLNNIALNTETLLDDSNEFSEKERTALLEQIYTQVERASSTVRNLLDFTRQEKPSFVALRLEEVLDYTAKLARNELSLAGVEFVQNLDTTLPAVRGNPRSLQQVFLNLFLNAIQAMPEGGRITVDARQENGYVRVTVTDTGEGIAPENLDRIFDPFFTTKETGEGTGLGLSVSYGIVEKHGGRLTVESELQKGTTFAVYLPVAE